MDQKGFCGGCSSDTPLDVGLNDAALEMNRAIAREVFGVPDEVILGLDAVGIPLPAYSTDRRAANSAMTKVWSKGREVRAYLEGLLARRASLGGEAPQEFTGISTAIVVLTPDVICEAVLATVRAYRDAGWYAIDREGQRAFRRTNIGGSSR